MTEPSEGVSFVVDNSTYCAISDMRSMLDIPDGSMTIKRALAFMKLAAETRDEKGYITLIDTDGTRVKINLKWVG